MATGTNGIPTVSELVVGRGLSAPSGYATNQCPPKTVIVSNMGGVVPSTYSSNQLVKYSDVLKAVSKYTLQITTLSTYASLALFPATGTPNASYNYVLIQPDAPKYYVITFNPGAALPVNNITYPTQPITVSIGSQYRVWGKLYSSSSWTLVATLTHVNSNASHLI